MSNELVIKINDPLNFRHTNTLVTTKVPHYPTKLTTGVSIVPGWNRPNSNGQNANILDKDYNGPNFKPRPLKHWRRQLRVYNYKNGANNSRSALISQLDRPGVTVYHFNPDCTCVDGEGGNSYIISQNKFGYETKGDIFTKSNDFKIQNNGYIIVPYNATEADLNNPSNPSYKILTGIYNTDCINCSPEGNIIRSNIAFQSQAFYSQSNNKLESRCQTYEQNISTNKALGCNYFDSNGIPLWPNEAPNGPQVMDPVSYGSTIYKGNYFNLYEYVYSGSTAVGSFYQVSSASFLPKVKCTPKYVVAGFYVNGSPASLIQARMYDSTGVLICISTNTQYSYINTTPPIAPSQFSLAARTFYFPNSIFIEPPKSYYIIFSTINSVNFDWLVNNYSSNILAGTLVVEPLYCPSKTIYKPNNVSFAKQGAVSGSTRIKKLVSDTVTMNGSSFYSAKGAEEANIGNYQGANISNNYYVKTKPVVNSCIGRRPSTPVLTVISITNNSITMFFDINTTGGCPILYYTFSYYPLPAPSNPTPTVVLISATESNIYTVTGFNTNIQQYNIYFNATNGNGTSNDSNVVTTKISPILSFTSFNTTGTWGSPYTLIQATITSPTPPLPGVTITYTSTNTSVATISGTTVTIVSPGTFSVVATTNETSTYASATVTSPLVTISKATLVLSFTSFNTTGTWGSPYTLIQANVNYPVTPPPSVVVTYTSTNTSVATISGTTVTVVSPGTFSVTATTAETQYYNSASTISPSVAISNTAEVIIYNNPKVFPRSISVSGEVGMITGIPGGTWPSGFSDFTSVSIIRGSVTVTYSSATTPTYSNCLNKYLVYGEPATASSFISNLSTGTASNIAFVGTSSLANGASSGVSLQFVFSGGFSTAPSTFTLNVDTGLINISQGMLYSKYPSITTSTVPPPYGSSSGYFTVGWKGYAGEGSNPSTLSEAWGISSNSASPPNPTASPLISSGTPPNHIFYPQTNETTVSYYYYIGIPKMIAPNY